MADNLKALIFGMIFIILILPVASCESNNADSIQQDSTSHVVTIQGMDKLNAVIKSAGSNLLMFDLYADWCGPCRILSPLLENIASENSDKVTVYKINVDTNHDIAGAFRVTGIPYVVLIKDGKAVHAFTGVQSKETYVRAIKRFSGQEDITADGEIVNGVRIIRLSTVTSPGKIYVFRGENVKLIIDKIDFAYSIHIPEYRISQEGTIGKDLEVTFKANTTGVFPIFCNGNCPTGDGEQYGQIVVMQYTSSGEAKYTEIDAPEAKKLFETENPLVLDVRTPNEYYDGHIKNAKLIPLQQLESRLSEIEQYKNKTVLVYCRSGNRSTVASEIMIRKGFTNLYNLKGGIFGWQKAGNELIKE